LRERDLEREREIIAAREAEPAAATTRARLLKEDSQVLATLLRQNPDLTPHKFAKKAQEEEISLTPQQVKGWLTRNRQKVLLSESHN